MDFTQLPKLSIQVLAAVIILMVAAMLTVTFSGVLVSGAAATESFEPSTDGSTLTDITQIDDVTLTTGYALAFSDGGHVDANIEDEIGAEWSVCAVAAVDEAHSDANMAIYAHDNESVLLEYRGGEWAAHYNDGSQTADATIEATDPHSLSPVCAVFDGDELVVWDGHEPSEPGQLSSETEPRPITIGFEGTIDEVRTFDGAIADDSVARFADEPVDALAEENHRSRMMFDEGEGTTTTIYYQDTDGDVVDAEWTDGVEGPELVENEDWSSENLRIIALEGGLLDGAPVGYAISEDGGGIIASGQFVSLLWTGLTLFSVVIIAAVAVGVVAAVSQAKNSYGKRR